MGQHTLRRYSHDSATRNPGLARKTFAVFQQAALVVALLGLGQRFKILRTLHNNHFTGSAATFATTGVHPIHAGTLKMPQQRPPLVSVGYFQHTPPQIPYLQLNHILFLSAKTRRDISHFKLP
jgi:hypothetical protein